VNSIAINSSHAKLNLSADISYSKDNKVVGSSIVKPRELFIFEENKGIDNIYNDL